MSNYSCEACNYNTTNKYDFKKHNETQKHKKNSLVSDTKKIAKCDKKYPKSIQKVSDNQFLVSSENQKSDSVVYECDYCDACFKHVNNKYRHQKSRCKAKRMHDNTEQLLKEKDKRIEELTNLLSESIKSKGNVTNNNNCVTNNLNITINGYGKEDLSYLTNAEWLKLLNNPDDGIVNLFIETHFNPRKPENQNIRQRNKNSKYLEVHDGEGWKHVHKKKVLSDVADDKRDILEEKYDTLQEDMENKHRDNHGEYFDNTYYDEKRNILERLEASILDNS